MSRAGLLIAIDGPSGAGKGAVARAIAARLAYRHVDTGAMYRAVAWEACRRGLDLHDAEAIAAIAAGAELRLDPGISINGHDVTQAIRTSAIDQAAAIVAQHPPVRAALVERQRRYGHNGGVVMEGRDIGSVVFPEADLKIYLDASPDERARRRSLDPAHSAGRDGSSLAGVAEAIEARDRRDRTRPVSPLTMAADAVYVDTTNLSIEDVVAAVMKLIEGKLAQART